MDTYEKKIVDYVCNLSYENLTKRSIEAAKERLLDSLSCAFAAYNNPAGIAMRRFASRSSSLDSATVLGSSHRAAVYDAVVANGTLIRALDWNDTYLSLEPAHPSDNIAATLAVADMGNKSGKDWILATVIAYEMQCRLCDAAGIRKKGWDHVTYGSISAAAGASKLLGLDPEKTRHAIAIAVTTGNYLRQTRIGDIAYWKAAAFAQAARNAVEASLYAREGMTGPYDIITGQHGLIAQITRGEFDLSPKFGGEAGLPFRIEETYIKYFPSEYHSQSAIWAALELREKIGGIDKIVSILIETSHHSYQIIGMEKEKWHPKTKETADHSLPYIVAVTLMDGELSLGQFDEKHLRDEMLSALMQKVTVKEKKEHTDVYGTSFPNKVTIVTRDGASHTSEVLDPKGHPRNPLSKQEIEKKFTNATKDILSGTNQTQLIETIWNFENVKNVREIMPLLVKEL